MTAKHPLLDRLLLAEAVAERAADIETLSAVVQAAKKHTAFDVTAWHDGWTCRECGAFHPGPIGIGDMHRHQATLVSAWLLGGAP